MMISLTLNDRCDACGAAAAKHVARKNGHELMFCDHCLNRSRHQTKHGDVLLNSGWEVLSDMDAINKDNYNPTQSEVVSV